LLWWGNQQHHLSLVFLIADISLTSLIAVFSPLGSLALLSVVFRSTISQGCLAQTTVQTMFKTKSHAKGHGHIRVLYMSCRSSFGKDSKETAAKQINNSSLAPQLAHSR